MIAGYVRVSTQEQKKGKTILSQELSISNFIGKKPDMIFKDEGWSGALLARPALDELRKKVKDGEVKEILIYHPDRLSRKQNYQFILLDEFEKAKVKVTFTALPDFFEGSQESQIVNKSIFSMVAELERARISERFRLGKLRKVSEGKIVSSKPPYGYKLLKGKHKFVFDPHEIRVVKMILQWAMKGKSDNEIISNLYKKGIKTRRGNDKWAKSTINKIVNTNLSVYSGEGWYYNKYKQTIPDNPTSTKRYQHTEKTSRRKNDKSEWIQVSLPKHLAVITPQEAALIRKNKRKNKSVKKGNVVNEYLLRGKVYCASCGGLDYCDNYHGVAYMRCADRQRSRPNPPKCKGGSIKAEILEKVVWKRLTEFITNPDHIRSKAEQYIQRHTSDSLSSPKITELLIRKNDLETEKKKLTEGYTKGFIDDEDMEVQSKRIKQELLVIKEEEHELALKKPQLNTDTLLEDISQLVEKTKEVLEGVNFKKKRETLELLNISVKYHQQAYAIKGDIPIPSKHFSKLPTINSKHGKYTAAISIPFLLEGVLKRGDKYPFSYII